MRSIDTPSRPLTGVPPVRISLIALALVALAAGAFAAPPEAKIVGPTGGQAGDILLLDATQSAAEHFAWEVTPKLQQKGRPTILPLEDGRKCIVTSVPGNYTVFLAAGNDEGIDLVEWPIKVGGELPPQPGPGPAPGPQPGPTPPTPDPGRFGLAAQAMTWSSAVTGGTRVAEAHSLGAAFDAVAAEIAAGVATTRQQILQSLSRQCSAAIRDDRRPDWAAFDRSFGAAINELYLAGKLATPDDWAVAFREVAAGLAAVR